MSVATLFFGGQLASWTAPGNRFLYFWQREDTLYLLVAIGLAAAVLWALARLALGSGHRAIRRATRLVFVLVLVQLLLALLLSSNAERPSRVGAAVSLGSALLVLAGFRYARRASVRAAVTTGLVLAPLAPLLLLQMLTWRSWRECPAPAPLARRGSGPPVFLIIFDEWSLGRSLAGDEFLPALPNVRWLAARSFVFRDARAPGTITYKSLPRTIYQDTGGLLVRNGYAEWVAGGSSVPVQDRPNLFRLARSHGYRTSLAGWYLPYAALVGDDLDVCRVHLQEVKRGGVLRLWDLLWANLQFLPDPLSQAAWRALHARQFSERWMAVNAALERELLSLAREMPPATLALIHYPLPHSPFVLDADGSYRGPYPRFRMDGGVADYTRHLVYMDVVLGRFLEALRQAGRFDSAAVIVTSDHSWQRDPDPAARTPERLQRVPLLVKLPGQRSAVSVPQPFCLLSLGSLFQATIGEPVRPAGGGLLLERLGDTAAAGACSQT